MSTNKINGIDINKLPKPHLQNHPQWVELYDFAWQLAAKNIRECKGVPYMDCAWDFTKNYQWVWDTCFMLLYAKYDNGLFPSISSLDNFYKFQSDDGFIAMTYDLDNGNKVYGERINPPLFAWVEWEYYLISNNSERFETVVPKIEKLMGWIDANRRTDPVFARNKIPADPSRNKQKASLNKLYPFYYFADCGSSGMDDSPRTPRQDGAGKFFDWIDLSSQMVLSFRLLAKMQTVLGNSQKSTYWNGRAQELEDAINRELWCKKTRFYHDRSSCPNFVNTKTVASFWTILAGIANDSKLESLVEYLKDEKTFNRPFPVPTLSADDCNYSEKGTYWIGGVWAPTNYMITRGLMNANEGELAHTIATKYLTGLSEVYKKVEPHTLWECYSPEEYLPGLDAKNLQWVKPNFVGWTGIGPIAMLIENILGINVDAPAEKITWHIRLQETQGIDNLNVGDATVSLHCKFTDNKPPQIKATSTSKLSLHIIYDGDIIVESSQNVMITPTPDTIRTPPFF